MTTFARKRRSRARSGLGPRNVATAVFVAGLAACGVYANLPATDVEVSPVEVASLPAGGFSGRVTRVVDGDTFWISSKDVRIRVWGLDAPERNDGGGPAATAALSRLISGQTLTCRQRDIDRYGRIVGQCFLPDGRDITAVMIESGTAHLETAVRKSAREAA
ncbi:MAG: thermonuclease family protein [Rhodobacteraceae bacterium]|nr:thermonuclease family protein [Paracoccaceae bacterium]